MKSIFKGVLPFLLLVIVSPFSGKAQNWEYGVSIGTSGYMGEYNPDKIYKFNSFSGSIGAKYNFNPTWGIRGDLSMVGINGKANYKIDPSLPVISQNAAFNSKNLVEFSVLPEFNFFKFEPNQKKAAYTPYVFAGLGAIYFKNIVNKEEPFKLVIPFGAGFKYNLKSNLTLDSHISYRLAITDALDDVGSGWTGGSFDKLNASDAYMTFQIGIIYTFFEKGCPTW